MNSFLTDEDLNNLYLEIENLESDINRTSEDFIVESKIERLDEIIQLIENSQRNIIQNQTVVRLF